MGRKKNDLITLINKRKHDVRISDEITIEALKSVDLEEATYQKILEENKHVRKAITTGFLVTKPKTTKGGN